jgi:hypothetical protein
MKAISFVTSIVLVGVLFVSADTQAQESPYEFWELQDDNTAEAVTSTNDVIPFQIRRRYEDQPGPSLKSDYANIAEPLAGQLRALDARQRRYYVAPTSHAVSGTGYVTSFTTRE